MALVETNNRALISHRQFTWLGLFLLLLLRIPFVIAIIHYLPIDDERGATVYEVGTYFLTSFLIWWERRSLAEFNIDWLTLAFIMFFRPVQTLILYHWGVDSPMAFPRPAGLTIWGLAIGLSLAIWRSKITAAPLSKSTFLWLAVGLISGIAVSVLENLGPFQSVLANMNSRPMQLAPLANSTGLNILYHLGFAPINEEPLFRGFLCGCLRRINWREGWIMSVQIVLFTLAHAYFAGRYPLMFWVFIPGAALLLGVLAFRSRSLAPGMLMHALINGSAYLLVLGLFTHLVQGSITQIGLLGWAIKVAIRL